MFSIARALTAAAAISAAAATAPALATSPADLCTGNPCVVGGAATVDAGSMLDFGAATELRLGEAAVLTIGPGAAPRRVTLRAATIVLEAGARILGGGDGAEVTLEAVGGGVELRKSGATGARIDLSGNQAGNVDLQASGAVAIAGSVDVRGSGADAQGGTIEVQAGSAIDVTGELLAGGSGASGAGGGVSIRAGDSLSLGGTLSTAGGGFGGGDVELSSARGDVSTTAAMDVSGAGPEGSAGAVTVLARAGSVELGGSLAGRGGTGGAEACGDGAELVVEALDAIVLGGPVDLTAGKHCFGGSLAATSGGDFTQLAGAGFKAQGPGGFGEGGALKVTAGGNVTLGAVDVTSPGGGGTVEATATATLTVEDRLDASGTGNGLAGGVTLQACELVVAAAGQVLSLGDADGEGGLNELKAGGAMLIAGSLQAAATNELRHRGDPPEITGSVVPAPVVVADPGLPACPQPAVCGNGETEGEEVCDDGNAVSCDGCSADCARLDGLCGDALVECGERCDDGNTDDGDGCESTCELTPLSGLRLPGVPRAAAGCLAEWALPAWAAVDTATGFAAPVQSCTDGDPACDADGAADGQCTFAVRTCLRVPDPALPGCSSQPVAFVKLKRPTPTAPGDAVDAANASRLADALAALGATVRDGLGYVRRGQPIAGPDACTDATALVVPTAGAAAASRKFVLGATDASGLVMRRNALRLDCLPRPERCGDGIVQDGEECDLGGRNGAARDGGTSSHCSAECVMTPPLLHIAGGSGGRANDCAFEWAVELDPDDVRADRRGVLAQSQSCRDNDAACDLDPAEGNCRFRVWGCLGGADARFGCAASQVVATRVRRPRAGLGAAFEQQARAKLVAALGSLALPIGPGETCTAHFEVDVPVGVDRLQLAVGARIGPSGTWDHDGLRLRCRRR